MKMDSCELPAPIPTGFIIKNNQEKVWQVGHLIGEGGFGEVYSCALVDSENPNRKTITISYPHVMKIEPQKNGPLFVEMHFYKKVAKKQVINKWMKSKGIHRLGIPCYIGSGTFDYNNERYRFIVLDKYGEDLWSIFIKMKLFPCSTALQIGLQIIDVLEYIHDQGYAHYDVKGPNILMGSQKGTEGQVYLLDYGLANRYSTIEYKPDPKNTLYCTPVYMSRDAHQGVVTRRGDMEMLGFNLLEWTTYSLPWDISTDENTIEEQKKSYMESISSSAKQLIPSAPKVILEYLEYVNKLKYDEKPDYNFCRTLFKAELKNLGAASDGNVIFKEDNLGKKSSPKTDKAPTARKRRLTQEENNSEESGNKENEPQPEARRQPSKKPKKIGPSWKDCATAKASNIVRAGEYVRKNPKPTKRKK